MAKDLLLFGPENLTNDAYQQLLENSTIGLTLGSCIGAVQTGDALTIVYRGERRTTARLIVPQSVSLTRTHELVCTAYDSRSGGVRRFAVDRIADHERVLIPGGRRLNRAVLDGREGSNWGTEDA